MAEPSEAGAHTGAARRNHAAWLGPLIAVPGFLSYWVYFSMWPVFRDVPWLNLLILLGAIALSVVAIRRAVPGWGRIGSIAGLVFSSLLLGMLCFYCFVLSYQLPDAARVVVDGTRIPAVRLASYDGTQIDVAQAAQEKLILVFYRGFW
jgi:hypothetical protein